MRNVENQHYEDLSDLYQFADKMGLMDEYKIWKRVADINDINAKIEDITKSGETAVVCNSLDNIPDPASPINVSLPSENTVYSLNDFNALISKAYEATQNFYNYYKDFTAEQLDIYPPTVYQNNGNCIEIDIKADELLFPKFNLSVYKPDGQVSDLEYALNDKKFISLSDTMEKNIKENHKDLPPKEKAENNKLNRFKESLADRLKRAEKKSKILNVKPDKSIQMDNKKNMSL